MRISDWSSDVCSSDLSAAHRRRPTRAHRSPHLPGRGCPKAVRACCPSFIPSRKLRTMSCTRTGKGGVNDAERQGATLTRPAPRERAEQCDLAARNLPVLRGEHRFGLRKRSFGVEPFERIRRAFLPLGAHDPRRTLGLVTRRSEEHKSEL